MNNESKVNTGTSEGVLDYYSRNWDKIANCYDVDENGLPIDPAWYRRRLYNKFLDRVKPSNLLDVGCGGGWTVLDALKKGIDARGIEPVAELKNYAVNLLTSNNYEGSRVEQQDLAVLSELPDASFDCLSLLSVLPHVPQDKWDDVHNDMMRVLKPGGRLVAAYRNELFDLFTFNSFTVELYDKVLWNNEPCNEIAAEERVNKLKSLITNSDVPGPYFTAAKDKSFGNLDRVKSNPLTMPEYLDQFSLKVVNTQYYHFHCVPPLLSTQVDNYREVNHQLELSMSQNWRGNFMAAIFMIEAIKNDE